MGAIVHKLFEISGVTWYTCLLFSKDRPQSYKGYISSMYTFWSHQHKHECAKIERESPILSSIFYQNNNTFFLLIHNWLFFSTSSSASMRAVIQFPQNNNTSTTKNIINFVIQLNRRTMKTLNHPFTNLYTLFHSYITFALSL